MLAALCAKMTSTSSYLVSPSLISLPMHCSWDSLTDTIICSSHYTSSVKNQCLPILPTHKIQASLQSSQNLIILFSSNFITHYPLTRSPHLQPNPFSHAMSSPASAPLPCRHPWNILFPFPQSACLARTAGGGPGREDRARRRQCQCHNHRQPPVHRLLFRFNYRCLEYQIVLYLLFNYQI